MRSHLPSSATLCALAVLMAGTGSQLHGQNSARLGGLAEAEPGSGVPSGWSLRSVGDARAAEVRVEPADGAAVLVMVADSAAGQAWLELEQPLSPTAGVLSWEWSLAEGLSGTDLRDPASDDAAGRFFVVFGGGGFFGRPRILFYTWGEGEQEVGEAFLSHTSDRAGVLLVRDASDAVGDWYIERPDLAADYRRVFGREPPEIRAVGLMADTDQLGGSAEVRLRAVWWEER